MHTITSTPHPPHFKEFKRTDEDSPTVCLADYYLVLLLWWDHHAQFSLQAILLIAFWWRVDKRLPSFNKSWQTRGNHCSGSHWIIQFYSVILLQKNCILSHVTRWNVSLLAPFSRKIRHRFTVFFPNLIQHLIYFLIIALLVPIKSKVTVEWLESWISCNTWWTLNILEKIWYHLVQIHGLLNTSWYSLSIFL